MQSNMLRSRQERKVSRIVVLIVVIDMMHVEPVRYRTMMFFKNVPMEIDRSPLAASPFLPEIVSV
jgi:hypothetical protein